MDGTSSSSSIKTINRNNIALITVLWYEPVVVTVWKLLIETALIAIVDSLAEVVVI